MRLPALRSSRSVVVIFPAKQAVMKHKKEREKQESKP
jgi:hypothetical protein